jgi:Zn-dependent peptidase ImmA (M78 family)
LFHEAAHILLHSKRSVFLDGTNGEVDDVETEANQWAADFLVPRKTWTKFIRNHDYRAAPIRALAEEQGIAPGILVGRLQHEELLPWNKLNTLKVKLQWADE